jgi:hypothetical protein
MLIIFQKAKQDISYNLMSVPLRVEHSIISVYFVIRKVPHKLPGFLFLVVLFV